MFKRTKQPSVVLDFDEPSIYTPPKRFEKIIRWVKAHKKLAILYASLGVLIIAGGTVTAVHFLTQKPVEPAPAIAPPPEPEPEPVLYYSPLTGAEVKDEAATKQTVTAIMIENSPDARPQSGLKNSGVVFEAIAEGGITRFLALYQEQKPELIGPVRSLRMYYVDWLAPFNASVAHIGGSAGALKEIRNGTYRDIDEFFNSGTYWRATDRYAPHNVYTNFKRIDSLNKAKGFTTSSFTGFVRIPIEDKNKKGDTDAPATTEKTETEGETAVAPKSATNITVTISSPLYNSQYSYSKSTNTYDRSQAGVPHLDREAGRISPRVVIVMKVNETTVMEDGWRQSIKTVGSGPAYIFQDGTVQEVTWRKTSRAAQIRFTNKAGDDVPLARGQTWITAVPTHSGGVTWK